MTTRFATSTFHSLDYYLRLLGTLVELLRRKLTHSAIAAELNDKGVLSPAGLRFNTRIVANTLRQLRYYEEFRPLTHQAMLQLFFDGRMSREDCMALIQARPGTQ